MKPSLDFKILKWWDALRVIKVRIYGTDEIGMWVDRTITLPEPLYVDQVAQIVAKMNNGEVRR